MLRGDANNDVDNDNNGNNNNIQSTDWKDENEKKMENDRLI